MKVAIASDHAGLALKAEVAGYLSQTGHEVVDLGTMGTGSVDYPDYAALVARGLRDGQFERGVLVCGTGNGMAITANKYRRVRAAVCTSEYMARLARAHNDANLLCLGERVVGLGQGRAIAEAFFGTDFEGGRHARRIQKIGDAENDGNKG